MGTTSQYTALQAADVLAYCTYRFMTKRYPQHTEKDFPVTPGFLRMIQQIPNDGGGFDLDSMKQLTIEITKRMKKGNKNQLHRSLASSTL